MWWLYRAGLGGSTVFVRKRALNIAALTSATMRTTFVASLLALATRTTGLSSTPTGRRLSWDELHRMFATIEVDLAKRSEEMLDVD